MNVHRACCRYSSVHVSDSVGPDTPKLAVATAACVTESVAEADVPPYEPVTVPLVVLATGLVKMENVALTCPTGTVTLGGIREGVAACAMTAAPPAGAPAERVTEPVTVVPPMTVGVFSKTETSATGDAVTVKSSGLTAAAVERGRNRRGARSHGHHVECRA